MCADPKTETQLITLRQKRVRFTLGLTQGTFMGMVVNSVAYKQGQRLGETTIEAISEIMQEPDTFIWLGINEPDTAFLLKIQEEFKLHELAIEDASHAHQRPKIEVYGDSLFIVLKTVHLNAEKSDVEYGETHIFVGKKYLISIRHDESQGYAPVREHCERIPSMLAKGPGFALYALLDFIVDRYQERVAHFEATFDQLEADIFKEEFDRQAIAQLYEFKRQLLQLRNAVLPVEDICSALMRFHEDIIPKDLRVYFRDIQDHVRRVMNSTDSMREMLTTAMQVHLALVGVAQNEVVKRQAGWAAVVAAPTIVFSLYGMNFQHMPELHWTFGYPLTLFMTLLGCIGLHRKLKKAGWL